MKGTNSLVLCAGFLLVPATDSWLMLPGRQPYHHHHHTAAPPATTAATTNPLLELSMPLKRGHARERGETWASSTRLWAQGRRWGGIRRKIQKPGGGNSKGGSSSSSSSSGGGNTGGFDPDDAPMRPTREVKKKSQGGGEDPEEWSMEWLETLEPEKLVSLDKTKLLKVLMGELDKDQGWEKLPISRGGMRPVDDDEEEEEEGDDVTGDDDYDNMEEEEDDDDGQYDHLWTEEELEQLSRTEALLEDEYDDPAIVAQDAVDETEEEEEEDELADEEEEEWAVDHDHLEGDEDDEEWEPVDWSSVPKSSHELEYETDEDDLWDSGDEADESDEMNPEAFLSPPVIMEDPQELRAALRDCVEYGDYEMAASLMEQAQSFNLLADDVPGLEELLAGGEDEKMVVSPADRSRLAGSLKTAEDQERAAFGLLTEQELEGIQKEGACVGIDLGTTNSAVSVVVDGKVIVIPNTQDGRNILPSAVRFTPGGGVVVGSQAKSRQVEDSDNTFVSVKRLIGRGMPELIEEREVLDTVNLVEKGQKLVAAYSPALSKEVTPEGVSAEILKALVASAEGFLERKVNRAVITVPAYFTQYQMAATERAGMMAGELQMPYFSTFNIVPLLNIAMMNYRSPACPPPPRARGGGIGIWSQQT